MKEQRIASYKLIKTYPGSKPLGYMEPYTTGELSKYPEFWEPVLKTGIDTYSIEYKNNSEPTELKYELVNEYPGSSPKGTIISLGENVKPKAGGFYESYPQFFKKVSPPEKPKSPFPTFCGLDVKFDGVSKDHVVIGNTVYSKTYFNNSAYLLRHPNIRINFNGHRLTFDIVSDFIKAIEDNN